MSSPRFQFPDSSSDAPVLVNDESAWNPAVLLWTVVGAVAIVGLGVVGWQWSAARTAAKTETFLESYAQAKDDVVKLGILENNAGLPAVVGEALPLGAKLLQGGNAEAAKKAFALAADHAKGDLLGTALVGEAQALAELNDINGAVILLKRVSTEKGTESSRPLALLLTGRYYNVAGKASEARQALEELKTKYPNSAFVQEADSVLRRS
ncbi:MAG TPA: tetratricopeptide repeat protein [Candidatus Methylacidiphilales bacterium]